VLLTNTEKVGVTLAAMVVLIGSMVGTVGLMQRAVDAATESSQANRNEMTRGENSAFGVIASRKLWAASGARLTGVFGIPAGVLVAAALRSCVCGEWQSHADELRHPGQTYCGTLLRPHSYYFHAT